MDLKFTFIRTQKAVAVRCLAACLTAFLCLSASPAWAGPTDDARQPILAGTWYPAKPLRLRAAVQEYISQAQDRELPGQLLGLIAPHAGYAYSGPVAGYAYKALATQRPDTVVVLAPSHHFGFHGVSVYDRGGYRTPLGVQFLDTDFIAALRREAGDILSHVPQAHAREHAVEIQVPFIQVAAVGAKLVPLVTGRLTDDEAREFAHALARTIQAQQGRVVLMASSDLSHYHSEARAKELDSQLAVRVEALDSESLRQDLARGDCQACGAVPIAVVMDAVRELGARSGQVLTYGHSGQQSGDNSRVVGYLAAAFCKDSAQPDTAEAWIAPPERALLHDIARQAVRARLDGATFHLPKSLPSKLTEPGAAFVTLKKHGQLRGCVGHVIAHKPLAETVAEMAQAAAFQDRRFPPLQPDEYADLEWEISVLTPMQRLTDPEQVVVGRDGLMMVRGFKGGLLLPQVPVEWGWDRATFLDQTCKKADMEPGCWRDPKTEIHIFQAEIF